MTLNDLKIGERAKIIEIMLPEAATNRLEALGIKCGVTINLVRFAPFGDPIVIKVYNSEVILRKSVAGGIFLRKE